MISVESGSRSTRGDVQISEQTVMVSRRTVAKPFLSRPHTGVASTASAATVSHQSSQPAEEKELEELMEVGNVQREFTFTDYDIMQDNESREDPPAVDLDPQEQLKQNYRKIYVESCKMLGIRPIQPIETSLTDSRIVLRTRGLGFKGARAIAIALVTNKKVKSLDLEDNWIGADGAISMAEMLQTNHIITEIKDLGLHLTKHNPVNPAVMEIRFCLELAKMKGSEEDEIGTILIKLANSKKKLKFHAILLQNIAENRIGTKGIQALADILSTNDTIRKLDISGSNLFDHDAKFIAKILENNYKLRELKVRHNKFGEVGGLYLGPAIANNDTLEILDLAWNHLRGKGAMAVAAGMQVNGGLRMLDISWNGFSAESCRVLGLSLKENLVLKELNISNNRLNTEAIGGLLIGLQFNNVLSTFRVGNNSLPPNVATIVLQAITKTEKSGISVLDMENIEVEEEFLELLEEVRKKRFMMCKTGRVMRQGQALAVESNKKELFMDLVQLLHEYMRDKDYQVSSLFKNVNADCATISREEFKQSLFSTCLPVLIGQLEGLVERLDVNKDGIIDLGFLDEMVQGNSLHERPPSQH